MNCPFKGLLLALRIDKIKGVVVIFGENPPTRRVEHNHGTHRVERDGQWLLSTEMNAG